MKEIEDEERERRREEMEMMRLAALEKAKSHHQQNVLTKSENIQSKFKESEYRLKERKTMKESAIQRQKRQWEEKKEIIN